MNQDISKIGGEAPVRVLRSMLFVPANVPRFVDKAHTRGADAIILDLEDSVALSEKASARARLPEVVATLRQREVEQIFVRVNRPLHLSIPDLEAAVSPDVAGIVLPKVHSANHVCLVSETISHLESASAIPIGSTMLSVRIETAAAFFQMEEIAAADSRVALFGLGGEDFSLSIGVEPSVETLIYPKQRAIIAAHAAGVTPIGLVGSGADFSNLKAMTQIVRDSRRFGFEGSACIHPAVVPILNKEFRPTAEEVDRSGRLVDAFQAGLGAGSASINFEGKMVDYPVAYRAERILKRHAAIKAAEERRPPLGAE